MKIISQFNFNTWSFIALILLLSYASCNLDTSVPPSDATGNIDEIVVIMEQQDWKGSLGDTVRHYFTQSYDLLPQYEPIFDVRYLKPEGFTSLLTAARNVVIFDVINRDQSTRLALELFGRDNIDVKENVLGKSDYYAKGQQILYVYAKTHEDLIDYIYQNNGALVRQVADNEITKLKNTVYLGGEDKALSQKINEKMDINIAVPKGYQLAANEDNMVWLRYDTDKYTANLWIQNFESTSQADDFGVISRNKFGRFYVIGSSPGSYMTTEDLIDYFQTKTTANGKERIESRGLWKMSADFLGGPFLNYCVADSSKKRTVVVDAFVMAPSHKKRQIMRQMEMLMNSIQI